MEITAQPQPPLSGVRHPTHYTPDPRMTWEQFTHEVGLLYQADSSVKWYLGDLLLFGENHFGARFSQVASERANDTLQRYMYVAQTYEPERRRVDISWSVYRRLCGLDRTTQDYWLDRVHQEQLSVRLLSEYLNQDTTSDDEQPLGTSCKRLSESIQAVVPQLLKQLVDDEYAMVTGTCDHVHFTVTLTRGQQ